MNIKDTLKSINAYPIADSTIIPILANHRLEGSVEATYEIQNSKEYLLAKADLYLWLSCAPDVIQEGVSYSFSKDQRLNMEQMATTIKNSLNPIQTKSIYGYKGSIR